MSAAFARTLEKLGTSEGLAVLSSCKQDELSHDYEEKGHGVFSYYLLEGLKGPADADADGIVTIYEISRYATTNTRRWAFANGVQQNPELKWNIAGGDITLLATGQFALEAPTNTANAPRTQIRLTIETGDALSIKGDVLVLKYAQALYGADRAVANRLVGRGIEKADKLPKPSEFYLANSQGAIDADWVLFVGVDSLRQFGYEQIREFGYRSLAWLAGTSLNTHHILVTIHGPGYGLDEVEAFESEIAGFVDAITAGDYPKSLTRISVVERDRGRAERLNIALRRLLPEGCIPVSEISALKALGDTATDRLRTVGYESASKPHVVVVMPFSEDIADVFHYGIQGAVNAAGFLCERIDLSTLTGDEMGLMSSRIRDSFLVIADLSTANPNVYLALGYAWGRDRPTILLVRDEAELRFDIRGQRCLVYKRIKDLEYMLRQELEKLRESLSHSNNRRYA